MADEPAGEATDVIGDALVDLAEEAIVAELEGRDPRSPVDIPDALRQPVGAFVTLHVEGVLRGCIGSIEGVDELADAVPRLACSAAFRDPRFPPLELHETSDLDLDVSVLSPLHEIHPDGLRELVQVLQPGVDGLVIEAGDRRGVFLPAVWRQIPEPAEFVYRLYLKADLSPGTWPAGIKVWIFSAEEYRRQSAGATESPVARNSNPSNDPDRRHSSMYSK